MDLAKILQELREELENLNAAISSLERLEEAGKRRGSEPEWLEEIQPPRGRRKRKADSEKSDELKSG
ncbi:MAG: hypothetical protein LAQ69_00575 [Acidobacteriia bacterium]|nr:hypothetical protein [Terriglobia bacterium]